MSDTHRYLTEEDIQLRINDTLCRLDGEPVYVSSSGKYPHVMCVPILGESAPEILDANSSRLDVSSPEFGMVQQGTDVYFGVRLPLRQQKQGLSNGNHQYTLIGVPSRNVRPNHKGFFSDKRPLAKSIKNLYPSIEEAREIYQAGGSVPLSRRIALSRSGGVEAVVYTTLLVGLYDFKKNAVTLANSFKNDVISQALSRFMEVR